MKIDVYMWKKGRELKKEREWKKEAERDIEIDGMQGRKMTDNIKRSNNMAAS